MKMSAPIQIPSILIIILNIIVSPSQLSELLPCVRQCARDRQEIKTDNDFRLLVDTLIKMKTRTEKGREEEV